MKSKILDQLRQLEAKLTKIAVLRGSREEPHLWDKFEKGDLVELKYDVKHEEGVAKKGLTGTIVDLDNGGCYVKLDKKLDWLNNKDDYDYENVLTCAYSDLVHLGGHPFLKYVDRKATKIAKEIQLTWYSDPGHAWLEVPEDLYKESGIKASPYSYYSKNRKKYYLEEDMDAGLFLEAMEEKGMKVHTKEVNEPSSDSFVRNLSHLKHGSALIQLLEDEDAERIRKIKDKIDFHLNEQKKLLDAPGKTDWKKYQEHEDKIKKLKDSIE